VPFAAASTHDRTFVLVTCRNSEGDMKRRWSAVFVALVPPAAPLYTSKAHFFCSCVYTRFFFTVVTAAVGSLVAGAGRRLRAGGKLGIAASAATATPAVPVATIAVLPEASVLVCVGCEGARAAG
jgi:hypothetical protein